MESQAPSRLNREFARLAIYAISSDLDATPFLLGASATLARDLDASVLLLFAEVVPYPMSLSEPPVHKELLEIGLSAAAERVGAETSVRILLCRDRNQAVREQLPPESVVVLASPPAWWRGPWRNISDRVLIRLLRADGHRVIVLNTATEHKINQLKTVSNVTPYGTFFTVQFWRKN